MTEISATPVEPTPGEPLPTSSRRSRRGLLIGISAGLVALVVAVIGVLFAVGAFGGTSPVLYTSQEENYSVEAPGEPTAVESQIVLPLALPMTATHWTEGDLYFSVSSANGEDLPPTPVWRGMFLHDVLVTALRDAPGVTADALESEAVENAFLAQPDEITLSGEPAFAFTLELEGAPAPFHVIFSAHQPSLYLVVYSDSDDRRDEDFVDSFTFLD